MVRTTATYTEILVSSRMRADCEGVAGWSVTINRSVLERPVASCLRGCRAGRLQGPLLCGGF